jgi:hypothetical protein
VGGVKRSLIECTGKEFPENAGQQYGICVQNIL